LLYRLSYRTNYFQSFSAAADTAPLKASVELYTNKKAPDMYQRLFVVWGGIEPPTQGFSVLCSTD
jgi:hypothetical protein